MRAYPTRVSLHSDAIAAPTPECDSCTNQVRKTHHGRDLISFSALAPAVALPAPA